MKANIAEFSRRKNASYHRLSVKTPLKLVCIYNLKRFIIIYLTSKNFAF